jgi:hypothetical protein
MIDLAQARLGDLAARADFRVADFRGLSTAIPEGVSPLVFFSSYALHHLSATEKAGLARQIHTRLTPGGWFVNADLIVAPSRAIEDRIQRLRVDGILSRAAGRDPRFPDDGSVRRFLDDLEAADADQPLALDDDLRILRENGFPGASVVWLEHREAVIAAPR